MTISIAATGLKRSWSMHKFTNWKEVIRETEKQTDRHELSSSKQNHLLFEICKYPLFLLYKKWGIIPWCTFWNISANLCWHQMRGPKHQAKSFVIWIYANIHFSFSIKNGVNTMMYILKYKRQPLLASDAWTQLHER